MTQCELLAQQIRRAFEGEAWHGDPLNAILENVTPEQAAAHPVKGAHSIWELLLHIAAWDNAVLRRAEGATVRVSDAENFPPETDASPEAWAKALATTRETHNKLVAKVASFSDSRLHERVPGKTDEYHTFYYMFSGIAQHELYHAGQIAVLKKFK